MRTHAFYLAAATLITSASAAALDPRATAVPGICTIGMDATAEDIPDPVAGTSNPLFGQYGWIVGTDGVQTDEKAYRDDQYGAHANGTYGGLSGGYWSVESRLAAGLKLPFIIAHFWGRNDQPDQTLDSSKEPSNVCDCYTYGVAAVTSGCRCRFACR